MTFTLVVTNIPLFLSKNGIGSVASAGYLTAIALLGVFAGGITVTRLLGAFKKRLVPFDLALLAAGFLLLGSTHSLWTVALSVFMIGLAEGMLFPLSFIKISDVAPPRGITIRN